MLTFVAAVNDREICRANLAASPCLAEERHELILQEGFTSAAQAYNDALERAENDCVAFVHQDVYLPESWMSELERALEFLARHDPNWGVLGCFGITGGEEQRGHVFTTGWGLVGSPFYAPMRVRTLDEMVLIVRRESGLRFSEYLPHFHFYGADICLEAQARRMRCYVIPAFCIHNTEQILVLPDAFYNCYRHFRRRRLSELPVRTSCIRVTRWNFPLYERRLREACMRLLRKQALPAKRLPDPAALWRDLKGRGSEPRTEK